MGIQTNIAGRDAFIPAILFSLASTLVFTGCQDSSSDSNNNGYTGRFFVDQNISWASHRGLTSDRYGELFTHYDSLDFMLIDVQARAVDNDVRYGMVWRKNTDGREWRQNRNMTETQMDNRMAERTAQGLRAMDIEGYVRNSSLQHAAIWVENQENIDWEAEWNLDESDFLTLHGQLESSGYRPIDFNAYDSPYGLVMAGIWYENVDDIEWTMEIDMTRSEYSTMGNTLSSQGFILIDYESYTKPSGQRYAGIWVKPNDYGAYQIRTGRDHLGYSNLWREYRDDGYRLADYSSHNTPSGVRYGGIWIENADRYRYSSKQDISDVIEDHADLYNTTGISVAVIHEGDVVYRKGFGDADAEIGKVAHSRTIYNAASISKVIGATLAAKLEAEGQLRDGTLVNLDLSLPTDNYLGSVSDPTTGSYLGSIPSHHTHTVEQLLAHVGCVAHYEDDDNPDHPYVNNRTAHYDNQSVAVSSTLGSDANEKDLWDIDLLPDCTIGKDRNYSTAAFTFIGAVLEQATGRPLDQLLREELFEPYGLSDTRVQFEDNNIPWDYERAVPYRNNGDSTSYSNSSWKVIGGGIESSAYDLARFGWMVLDGQIIDDTTRDSRLWSPVGDGCTSFSSGTCRNGLGWRGYSSYFEHGGSWTGAYTRLRIYPDDDLVIAVMSNKIRDEADGTRQDQAQLIRDIRSHVLSN